MFGSGEATRRLLDTLTQQSNAALEKATQALEELRDHVDDCVEDRRRTSERFDAMSEERRRMHVENRESIRWLFRVIWSTALTIMSGLGYLVYQFLKQKGELP